ncbi:MAG: hypothetical protein ABGW79_05905, partial [Pirellulales bacterium]
LKSKKSKKHSHYDSALILTPLSVYRSKCEPDHAQSSLFETMAIFLRAAWHPRMACETAIRRKNRLGVFHG